jgi:hypothetical protein
LQDWLHGDQIMPPATIAWLCWWNRYIPYRKQLPLARTPHEQTALERQIEAADRQIDALVYELYGLTEEEIGIVEGRG